MLEERVDVESILEREETNFVIVTIRLPEQSEAERLSIEEWVQICFQNAQDRAGGAGLVLVPRYVYGNSRDWSQVSTPRHAPRLWSKRG